MNHVTITWDMALGGDVALRLLGALLCWGLGAALAGPAWPAQILVSPATGTAAQITITGKLDLGDALNFLRKTGEVKEAVVLLQSAGGNTAAGISIGRAIRQKGFLTLVPSSVSCASACALAWLGGVRRFMGEGAKVGFHAAYTMSGGRARRSASGNAALVKYVNGLGLTRQAIDYITGAPPERMYWLSLPAAQALGIEAGPYAASGIANAGDRARFAPMMIQAATDYPGNDIGRLKQATLDACLVACSAAKPCKAFTFVTYSRECWLKNEVGSAEPREGLVSGIK